MIHKLFTIHALSPLHCGVGQGLNDIDLPTARSPISGHPIIPASSIKGVLKSDFIHYGLGKKISAMAINDMWKNNLAEMTSALFGEEGGTDFASAISIGDANLLALPIRSFFGTFAYVASPHTLNLFRSNIIRTQDRKDLPLVPTIGLREENGLYKTQITRESLLRKDNGNRVIFEELDLLIEDDNANVDAWAELIAELFFADDPEGQKLFRQRFAIVDDNVLNFCCETGLPVNARIRIDPETGTVKQGALWYEESVPMESLFTGVAGIQGSYKKGMSATAEELAASLSCQEVIHCQLGGKATTGKGFVALKFAR